MCFNQRSNGFDVYQVDSEGNEIPGTRQRVDARCGDSAGKVEQQPVATESASGDSWTPRLGVDFEGRPFIKLGE